MHQTGGLSHFCLSRFLLDTKSTQILNRKTSMASGTASSWPRTAARWRRKSTSVTFDTAFFHRLIHEGPDTIDELLDRHLVKDKKKSTDEEDEVAARRRLTSSRREALSLYRDILRATRFFPWPDSRGVPWREVLRANARKEFEEAKYERDPEVITRLLIGGRDAVQAALDKLVEKYRSNVEEGGGGGVDHGRR